MNACDHSRDQQTRNMDSTSNFTIEVARKCRLTTVRKIVNKSKSRSTRQ